LGLLGTVLKFSDDNAEIFERPKMSYPRDYLGNVNICWVGESFHFIAHTYKVLGGLTMAVEKVNSSSSLAEVVDRILDKGVVVDAWVRVSLVGIELLAIEARIVIASVETYLKYAEAVGLTAQAAVPSA
jgi:hypothetical protein